MGYKGLDCIRGLSANRNGVAKDTTPATRFYYALLKEELISFHASYAPIPALKWHAVHGVIKHVPQYSIKMHFPSF
jgi:hypothetical protein